MQARPTEVLDLTSLTLEEFPSLTLEEFQRLVAPFEAVFQAPMAHWRLDGEPRTARR